MLYGSFVDIVIQHIKELSLFTIDGVVGCVPTMTGPIVKMNASRIHLLFINAQFKCFVPILGSRIITKASAKKS